MRNKIRKLVRKDGTARLTRIAAAVLTISIFATLRLIGQDVSAPAANSDEVFAHAVQDYGQNRFLMARTEFDKVSGTHAPEAKQYIARINAYLEDMQVGGDVMGRSADELDAPSLEYAIQKYEDAVKIKADGPGDPAKALEKAKALYAPRVQQRAVGMQTRDLDFCNKALAAAKQHKYQQAVLYSCPLANDNPAYVCGGYEAVQFCQQMGDLAKSGDSTADDSANEDEAEETTPPPPADSSSLIGRARASFDKNDFDKARLLLAKAGAADKAAADEYLDKISRYQNFMAQGKQFSDALSYDEARVAFGGAAKIKADGPGNPRSQALLMQLEEGIDQFYSGDYVSAMRNLQGYTQESKEKESLARFYLGASKLARFFITGNEDPNLQQDALQDLKIAKQAGYKVKSGDLSPRILQAYNEL